MLYTFGKIFFPRLIHEEKKLRARMRWVTAISGLLLVIGVVSVIYYANTSRLRLQNPAEYKAHKLQPPR